MFSCGILIISVVAWLCVFSAGVYGHSAVYHEYSNSIYVHGGYEYMTDRATVSSNLYVLDLHGASSYNASWSVLPPDPGNRVSYAIY